MSVNLHLLETTRPDLTYLVANLVDRYHTSLAGTIRVDYFINDRGMILGTHFFYVLFREPGSIGQFTAFVCGANSGNFSVPAQAFKRLMDTLHSYSAPLWSIHPHDPIELSQVFGVVQNHYGLLYPNIAAMQGFHPGQYNVHFLETTDQFAPSIRMLLSHAPASQAVHEAFLCQVLSHYGMFWGTVYNSTV